jgi:hypothetical protein
MSDTRVFAWDEDRNLEGAGNLVKRSANFPAL